MPTLLLYKVVGAAVEVQRKSNRLGRPHAAVIVQVGDLLDAHADLLVDDYLPDHGEVDLVGGLLNSVAEFQEGVVIAGDDAGGVENAVRRQLGLLVAPKREGDARRRPVNVAQNGRALIQSRDHNLVRFHGSSLQRMGTER